jgi:lipoate-protein ligase A
MFERDSYLNHFSVNIISTALKKLLIPSKVTCRYDIVVDEKKISGSAYKLINSRAYHHGTMLINSNLNNLELALSPIKVWK